MSSSLVTTTRLRLSILQIGCGCNEKAHLPLTKLRSNVRNFISMQNFQSRNAFALCDSANGLVFFLSFAAFSIVAKKNRKLYHSPEFEWRIEWRKNCVGNEQSPQRATGNFVRPKTSQFFFCCCCCCCPIFAFISRTKLVNYSK